MQGILSTLYTLSCFFCTFPFRFSFFILKSNTMSIPVVDLAEFLSGDPQRKAAFVEQLGKAYEEVGFVAVKNHGVPDELIANQ